MVNVQIRGQKSWELLFFVRIQPPIFGIRPLLLLRGVHLAVTQFAFPSSEGPYRSPIPAHWQRHIGTIPLLHSSLIPHVSVNQRTKLRATRRCVSPFSSASGYDV